MLQANVLIIYCFIRDYDFAQKKIADGLNEILTEIEIERYGRFIQKRDKINFILGRYIVRSFSGSGKTEFLYGENNKPFMTNGPKFNISHTEGLVAAVISGSVDSGIDVEKISETDIDKLSCHFASESERKSILSKKGTFRLEEFYRIWTSKEAILKSDGTGLTDNLTGIDVDSIISEGNGTYLGRIIDSRYYMSCYFLEKMHHSDIVIKELDERTIFDRFHTGEKVS